MSKVGELIKGGIDTVKGFSPSNIVKNITKESVGKLFESGVEIFNKVQDGKISVAEGQLELEQMKLQIDADADARADEIEVEYLKDTANARSLQKTAIKSDDPLIRRFIYYLAAGSILLTFVLIGMLFFIAIPPENKTIVDMAMGSIITVALIQIYNFFFGSSQGSKDKADQLKQLK